MRFAPALVPGAMGAGAFAPAGPWSRAEGPCRAGRVERCVARCRAEGRPRRHRRGSRGAETFAGDPMRIRCPPGAAQGALRVTTPGTRSARAHVIHRPHGHFARFEAFTPRARPIDLTMHLNADLSLHAMAAALAASLVNGCGSPERRVRHEQRADRWATTGPRFRVRRPTRATTAAASGTSCRRAHRSGQREARRPGGQSASLPYTVMGIVDGAAARSRRHESLRLLRARQLSRGRVSRRTEARSSRRACPWRRRIRPSGAASLTVQAQALNPGNAPLTITTPLTVELDALFDNVDAAPTAASPTAGPDEAGVPSNAPMLFANAPVDPTRAPTLEYPNNGAMLPPNLRLLDVHWLPGSPNNTLYRISFTSPPVADHVLQPLRHARRDPDARLLRLSARRDGLRLPGGVERRSRQRHADHQRHRRHRDGRRHVELVHDPVRAGAGQRRRLLLGRLEHAHHALRLRQRVVGAAGVPGAGRLRHERGNCVGCHTLSRDGTKIAASALRPGQRPARLHQRHRRPLGAGRQGHGQRGRQQPYAVRVLRSARRPVRRHLRRRLAPRPAQPLLSRRNDGAHRPRADEEALVRARPPRVVAGRHDDRDDARRRRTTRRR